MTLDDYDNIPNAMRLQVAMALIAAAQEHTSCTNCETDMSLAALATVVLEDYVVRRDSGRGIDLQFELSADELGIMSQVMGKIDLVRLQ